MVFHRIQAVALVKHSRNLKLAFRIFVEQLHALDRLLLSCKALDTQKGDDMLSLIDRLIGDVVRLFSAFFISKPAAQRLPVRSRVFIRRTRR